MPEHQTPPVGLLSRPGEQRPRAAAGLERALCDLSTFAARCARIAQADLESLDIGADLAWVTDAAAAAAGRGIPVEAILQTVHESLCAALSTPDPGTRAGPTTPMRYLARTSTMVGTLDLLTSTISSAYLLQVRALTHASPEQTLAAALLAGTASSTQARQCGIEAADAYHVLALAIPHDPPPPDSRRPGAAALPLREHRCGTPDASRTRRPIPRARTRGPLR